MVDFNNETTIGVPPLNILKILILEKRENVYQALEHFEIQEFTGVETTTSHIKARLNTFFRSVRSSLKEKIKPEEYEQLKNDLKSNDYTILDRALEVLEEYCLQIKLTKLDLHTSYDTTNAEKENEIYGY